MDLSPVKDAFDRASKKQKVSSSKSQDMIHQIEQEIEQALSSIKSDSGSASPTDHKTVLNELKTKLKEISPLCHLEAAQKELNIALTKYPKLVEKSFNPDISKAYRNVEFDAQTLNKIIANHLYSTGDFTVGDNFVEECDQPEAAEQKGPFQELFQILESMRCKNFGPAIKWAVKNRAQLEKNGSHIEMKLHRVQFLEILKNGTRDEALAYARASLAPLATKHMSEIQRLVACILWAGKLESSPYADLVSSVNRENLTEELKGHFCNLMGQSSEGPLSVAIEAGARGLPTLLKLMNVMTGKRHEWLSMKQLPVPVDLGPGFQFHSVFVCPVSREQASEENPPMLLSCGHVLCKQSIAKLSKNNSTRPFKCPYCPVDVEAGQCRQLFL